MKQFCFAILVISLCLNFYAISTLKWNWQSPQTKESKSESQIELNKELDEELKNIYKLIGANNSTQYVLLDNYGRLLHYVSGHDFRHSVMGCPECGFLSNLNKRKQILSDEIQSLSDSLVEESNDVKRKELEELTFELSLVDQHIYLSDERSKEISKKMFSRGE